MDYKNLPTPPKCVADFCLIPIGTPTPSVSNEVAAVQRLMKASGLSYTMHSAGTTVEGPWTAVMTLIGQAHTLVHQTSVLRIQSDIRVGTRTDKDQTFEQKVQKVREILAADGGGDDVGVGGGGGGSGSGSGSGSGGGSGTVKPTSTTTAAPAVPE